MALAKRKEVVTVLQKQTYGGILLAPALNGDNNLTFKLKAGKKEVETVIFFPDSDGGEYGCMLGEDFEDLGKGDPLVIVNKLVADFAKKNGLQLPGAAPAPAPGTPAPAGTAVPKEPKELKPSPRNMAESGDWRNESTDSWRHESTGSDAGDDLHNEWARAEVEAESKWQENVDMVRDVKNHKALFGEPSIAVKPMGALEVVNIELNLQLRDVIDENIGVAWGVDVRTPLTLSLSFSFYYLDSTTAPKLEIYQMKGNAKDKAFKLRSQLTCTASWLCECSPFEAIISTFVSREWPIWSGKKRPNVIVFGQKETPNDPKTAPAPADSKSNNKSPGLLSKLLGSSNKDGKKEIDTVMDGPFKKPVSSPPSGKGGSSRDGDLAQLSEMGFTIEAATAALNTTKTFDEALALLLAGGADMSPTSPPQTSDGPMTSLPAPKPISSKFMDELAKASAQEHKYVAEYGFLVALHSYLKGRVPTLSNYCVICDQPHVFGNMLKPAVCTRELCCWSFQQLGVGAGSADEIATAAEVVDLLVSFASAAANSQRKETIFEPYPTIMDPRDSKKALMSPQSKDFAKLCEILNKMPSIEKIANAKDAGDMKSILDKAHPMANDMLSWIISSNRSHIVKIPKEKHVKSMVTPHQYLLMSAPPEKEAKFRDLKAKHGSVFAFHGSNTENWHCILRVGLKNASGTKLQVNGAAYGAGIYLSPAASVSFGYSRMYGHAAQNKTAANSSNRFLVSSSVHCIAICEVINTNDIRKSGDIWVQPHEDHVLTRFFFVYLTPDPGSAVQNHCSRKEFETELRAAMDLYGH